MPTQPPTPPAPTNAGPDVTQPAAEPSAAHPTPTSLPSAEGWFRGMTTEQKIGQVMVIGFDGVEATPELLEMVTRYHVGGVILFARNVESPAQVARLTNTLQKAAVESGHPGLIVAVDQEGGRVARLTEDKGFTEFPGAMAVAATGDLEVARDVARAMATELRAVGINTNFAPDLDVNNNPQNPVIGIRSYGSEPERVAEFGVTAITAMQEAGVLAVGKHFPGHGDTGVDSHVSLPLVPHDRERLNAVEFVPFRAAIEADVAGIMSAHITFPAIEATPGLPATLSPAVLQDLLRGEMGYDGLVFTDSLEMGALGEAGYPVPLAAATALQSGADVLLFNRDHSHHKAAIQIVAQWVEEGKITQARLDEAVLRTLKAKERFGMLQPQLVDESAVDTLVGSEEAKLASGRAAIRSITLLKEGSSSDRDRLLPLSKDKSYVVIESAGARGVGKALELDTLTLSVDAGVREANRVADTAAGQKPDAVIIATTDAVSSEAQAALVNRLIDSGTPVIAVAVRGPYDVLAYPRVDTYVLTYGLNPPALRALAIMMWNTSTSGILPVEIPGMFEPGYGILRGG